MVSTTRHLIRRLITDILERCLTKSGEGSNGYKVALSLSGDHACCGSLDAISYT